MVGHAGTFGLVEPSLVTFNTLISACGKAGQFAEALELHAKMQRRGLKPDNFTVSSLIVAASKAGRWQAARELFEDFCRKGGRANIVTYNAMVRVLIALLCSALACTRNVINLAHYFISSQNDSASRLSGI